MLGVGRRDNRQVVRRDEANRRIISAPPSGWGWRPRHITAAGTATNSAVYPSGHSGVLIGFPKSTSPLPNRLTDPKRCAQGSGKRFAWEVLSTISADNPLTSALAGRRLIPSTTNAERAIAPMILMFLAD